MAASASQSMAWTTSDTRYKSAGISRAQELSSTDSLMQDDSIIDEQASALVSTYETPAENSLLTKTGDMTTFMNCSRWRSVTRCSQIKLIGQIRKEAKLGVFEIWQQGKQSRTINFQDEGCSLSDFGLELLVSEQMWIEDVCTYYISDKYGISHCWFNRQKFYIKRHDSPSRKKEVKTHMRILSVVRIKAYSRYGYDYLSKIVLRRVDFQEYTIAEKDFKNLYPSDFEDLNLLLLQGHLDYLPGYEFKHDYTIIESPRAVVFPVNNNERKIMRFNEIYKFSDGTLTRILEALDYRVKEFKVKRLNPGMNTRFWTQKDVTRSKEFIAAIEKRLKTRRIYRNLECFVGGRVRDIDYMLL
ncbi:hypothetical protein Tco_0046882 [Tanacetum coccineum]